MIELQEVSKKSLINVNKFFPGNKSKYWVDFNWYWQHLTSLRNDIFSFIVKYDGFEVGYLVYGQRYSDRELTKMIANEIELYHIVIDFSYQGLGLGKSSIILAIEQILEKYSNSKISVACNPENIKSIELYKCLGFKETGCNYDGDPIFTAVPSDLRLGFVQTNELSQHQRKINLSETNSSWISECKKYFSEFDWSSF